VTRLKMIVLAALTAGGVCYAEPDVAPAGNEQDSSTQSWNIPEVVTRLFKKQGIASQFDISLELNPFYLRGDFDGDGKPDIAVLVREKNTRKIGIAICNSQGNKVVVVGAGRKCGNGSDDFVWMDVWAVYPKGSVRMGVGERSVPVLRGEALYVAKSESCSALIYWNGKDYVWYQQAD
jgi:hypothetical protein